MRNWLAVSWVILVAAACATPDSESSTSVAVDPLYEPEASSSPVSLGSVARWSKVEIELMGPQSIGLSKSANPFKIEVDVLFNGPGGRSYTVPAFYDGDGNGGLDGTIWKVRFTPDANGSWSYKSISSEPRLNGESGSFEVESPTECSDYVPGGLPNLQCVGRLEYAGGHYLRFSDGPYWLKGGADDPEDFLAPGVNAGFSTKQAAIDYLADKGVNSIYVLLNNVDGDGRNVWPWVGSNQASAKANHEYFDLAKLEGWEQLFTYIQSKGLILHLVLEDDSAWTGFDRTMYYREMIARFGHHNGIIWNIAEEYNESYSARQVKDFAQDIRSLDPYDHPITVHHAGSLSKWNPFVGDSRFDLTSFQTDASPQNVNANFWFAAVESSGRTIPISFDETGKLGASDRDLARHIIWSVYLGGGNFEMHTFPLAGYPDFANHFSDMTRAREFVERLPFWEMRPSNELISSGQGYVFGKSGDVYAAYLPNGGSISIDLTGTSGEFRVSWFNPRDGSYTEQSSVSGGSVRTLAAPFGGDAVLLLSSN
ncbi:MAG: DUF5060 domain-containing protein [Anaerolineales bacterium]